MTKLFRVWFKDLSLGPNVDHACHALSIDDERLTFQPELWEDDPRVEQVWFSGVHSNVGGGYPKQGLSMESLHWMMTHAQKRGLHFIQMAREYVINARDAHGKLYDSREGMALYYRWCPRNISKLCKDRKIEKPKIHVSVFERIAQGPDGYAPGNIPFDCEIVSHTEWPGENILDNAQSTFAKEGEKYKDKTSLLDDNKCMIKSGKLSYYGFLLLTVIILLFGVLNFLNPRLMALFAIIGAAIWLWAHKVDSKLDDEYSKFWFDHPKGEKSLRDMLQHLGL